MENTPKGGRSTWKGGEKSPRKVSQYKKEVQKKQRSPEARSGQVFNEGNSGRQGTK